MITTHMYSKSIMHVFVILVRKATLGDGCVHVCLKFTVHIFMCL